MPEPERTVPSDETRAEEAREAHVPSGDTSADRSTDEADAPDHVDEAVAEHYREMTDRGAHQPGEGRLP